MMPPLRSARIASFVPGRIRLRLTSGVDGRHRLTAAAEALGNHPGVISAQARERTASLLVEYDPAATDGVWSLLGDLGLPAVESAGREITEAKDPPKRLMDAAARANDLVGRRTNGDDLRTLVPLGLGALSLRQFLREGQRLSDAPWYVLAWYASETFQKFHHPKDGERHG